MEDIDADFVTACSRATSSSPTTTSAAAARASTRRSPSRPPASACVIADTFARIFYRNAINTGLPIVDCPAAIAEAETGDRMKVDLDAGTVENLTRGKKYQAEAFPPFMQELIDRGGLMEYVKAQIAEGDKS